MDFLLHVHWDVVNVTNVIHRYRNENLLHGIFSLQILMNVMVNHVRTMEHVMTCSTITDVTVSQASTEPIVKIVCIIIFFFCS